MHYHFDLNTEQVPDRPDLTSKENEVVIVAIEKLLAARARRDVFIHFYKN